MILKIIDAYPNLLAQLVNIIARIWVSVLKFQHVMRISTLILLKSFVFISHHAQLDNIMTLILEYAQTFQTVQEAIISTSLMGNVSETQFVHLHNTLILNSFDASQFPFVFLVITLI